MRLAAGLTQAEVARLSGVAQPNIAAYEAGRRRPSPAMSARLRQVLRPRPSDVVKERREDILAALARHGMTGVRVFGSVAAGVDRPGSDLDLLVDFAADGDLLDLIDGAEAVEQIVGTRVDIVTSRSLGPDHEISRTAVPL